MPRILHIDASARREGSITREIGAELVSALAEQQGAEVVRRDLAVEAPGFVDGAWVAANFTAPDDRDAAARQRLAASDALVDELQDADVLVIGAPIYNFGVPAVLKAWIRSPACTAPSDTPLQTEGAPRRQEGLHRGRIGRYGRRLGDRLRIAVSPPGHGVRRHSGCRDRRRRTR